MQLLLRRPSNQPGRDLGQANNPLHPDGLLAFYQYLAQQGFTQAEIDRMAKVNPAKVLGLEP